MQQPASVVRLACGLWIACAALFALYFSIRFGLDSPPSATGDEPSYDSIGWQLAQGHGFREDFNDPVFRRPYDEAAVQDPALMTLPNIPAGTITYRPPLFPAVIAAADWVFGPQFRAVRLVNILAITACGAMAFHFAWRHAHPLAGILALLIFLWDVRVRLYARAILTEALAMLLATLMTLLLVRLLQRPRWQDGCWLGVAWGLAVLNRTALMLWIPGILLGMLVLAWFHRPQPGLSPSREGMLWPTAGAAREGVLQMLPPLLLAVSVLMLVYGPWAVRNCVVLDRFMPLGAQGMMELSAAFSDRAVQRQGVWFNLDDDQFFQDVTHSDMTRLERERARADYSRHAAVQWMAKNPGQVLRLAVLKIFHEYRPRSLTEGVILVLAACGTCWTWRQRWTHVFLLLHLVNALMIGATWSVEGRFVVPLLFSLHVLSAIGGYRLLIAASRRIGPVPRSNLHDPVGKK